MRNSTVAVLRKIAMAVSYHLPSDADYFPGLHAEAESAAVKRAHRAMIRQNKNSCWTGGGGVCSRARSQPKPNSLFLGGLPDSANGPLLL